MKNRTALALLVLAVSSQASADSRCEGNVKLSPMYGEAGDPLILSINDRVIAKGLTKLSPAFATFVYDCVKNRQSNLELNQGNPEAERSIRRQCEGEVLVESGAPCGMHFVLSSGGDSSGKKGGYQSVCHPEDSKTDPYIVDLRRYCEGTFAGSGDGEAASTFRSGSAR